MEWSVDETKPNPARRRGREMKRVSATSERPVVIPPIVVAVDVHVALVVPAVEGRDVWDAIRTTARRNLSLIFGLYLIRHRNARAPHTKYLHFLKCLHTPRYPKP